MSEARRAARRIRRSIQPPRDTASRVPPSAGHAAPAPSAPRGALPAPAAPAQRLRGALPGDGRDLVADGSPYGGRFVVSMITEGRRSGTRREPGRHGLRGPRAERLADGRWVLAVGVARARLGAVDRSGPYALVEVVEIDEPVGRRTAGRLLPSVQAALDAYLATGETFRARTASVEGEQAQETTDVAASLDEVLKPIHLPDDPVAASYAVAGVLQIELDRKQQLLELPDAASASAPSSRPSPARGAPPRRWRPAPGPAVRPRLPPELTDAPARLPGLLALCLGLAACATPAASPTSERAAHRRPGGTPTAVALGDPVAADDGADADRRRRRAGTLYTVRAATRSQRSRGPSARPSTSSRPGTRIATRRWRPIRTSSSPAGS